MNQPRKKKDKSGRKKLRRDDQRKYLNSSSSLTPSSTTGTSWESLPPEVQEIVLKNLETCRSLLTCRLVDSSFKEVVDSVLEKRSLSLWTNWNPYPRSSFAPQSPYLPVMKLSNQFHVDGENGPCWGLEWNHSALPTIENLKLGGPFPTNSFQIEIDKHSPWAYTSIDETKTEMLTDLCVSYGHYLTTFVLSELTTSFEVLNGILSGMENLKALTMRRVLLLSSSNEGNNGSSDLPLTLPPLPNLTHLKVINCISHVSQLFLNAYSCQLTCLETGAYIRPCPEPFTNLRQLTLNTDIKPNLTFPQLGPSPFPALQFLSVIHESQAFTWDELSEAIESLPKKLVHLHLNVKLKDEEPEEMTSQNQPARRANTSFPNLRKLGMLFPHNQNQAQRMGRWILSKFSNLQVLHLMCFHFDYTHDLEDVPFMCLHHRYDADNKIIAERLIDAGGIWRVCPSLQKVVVHRRIHESPMHEVKRNT